MKKIKLLFELPIPEVLLWLTALVYLGLINPAVSNHFSFCLLNLAGFEYCPGCGTGRVISFFMHGDIIDSLKTHPLGIPAFFIIFARIIMLIIRIVKQNFVFRTEDNNGKCTSVNA